jgi:hypothetical protein
VLLFYVQVLWKLLPWRSWNTFAKKAIMVPTLTAFEFAVHSRIILSKNSNILHGSMLFTHLHNFLIPWLLFPYIYIQLLFSFFFLFKCISLVEYTRSLYWFPFEYMLLNFVKLVMIPFDFVHGNFI